MPAMLQEQCPVLKTKIPGTNKASGDFSMERAAPYFT